MNYLQTRCLTTLRPEIRFSEKKKKFNFTENIRNSSSFISQLSAAGLSGIIEYGARDRVASKTK